ncbi:hypothetical protein HPB50_015473 [Hyalomma asiaticum]|uniref:Uncharacterized protein n=1 Tax=Hyalomma asiaticum TaxID=266040 RepID=A0ACB7S6K4_HYAAI|nr:hypothetical protein HPB50_015473 [Hyalomma asiaticum]
MMAVCICKSRILSWHARYAECPSEVQALSGFLQPFTGHTKRICKILRAEWMYQVRYFTDCLRAACWNEDKGKSRRDFLAWRKTSNQIAEWMWEVARPSLPKPRKLKADHSKVMVLGEGRLPEEHRRLLGLGPKFALQPRLGPPEKIALARTVTRRGTEEERPRFIAECVEVIGQCGTKHSATRTVKVPTERLGDSRNESKWVPCRLQPYNLPLKAFLH